MRVKWNRHLDGSSSRREDGTEDVPEELQPPKEKNKHSSPSIFRIFRRKKSRQRPDSSGDSAPPSSKSDLPNFLETPAPSEADEDDCASISSVATCASQPVNEVCHRDRTLSLFSSFRLSFPKKKKKRAAGSSDGKALDNRFSSPDLRRHPSDSVQALSSSSQSVPNPKDTSKSLRCLEELRMENSESLGKLKCPSSETKLVKSVSFSECKLPSPCSRLPRENINEMNNKMSETALEEHSVPNKKSCFSASERKAKLVSDATPNNFFTNRHPGMSDMLESVSHESSDASNKTTGTQKIKFPDLRSENPHTENCHPIESPNYESNEPAQVVSSVPASDFISPITSDLSKCSNVDAMSCDLKVCDASTFDAPVKDCDLCGESNVQAEHDFNSNKVCRNETSNFNVVICDAKVNKSLNETSNTDLSFAPVQSEDKPFNEISNANSNLVPLPSEDKPFIETSDSSSNFVPLQSKDKPFNETSDANSNLVPLQSKDKPFNKMSESDTNFVLCESNKYVIPSISEEVSVEIGFKSIPTSFQEDEALNCDESITDEVSVSSNSEKKYNNITTLDLCSDLKISKQSDAFSDSTVDGKVDSETCSEVFDYDFEMLKRLENYLNESAQNSHDDISMRSANISLSETQSVKSVLNVLDGFENTIRSKKYDVENNSDEKYFDKKSKLADISVNAVDISRKNLCNLDKIMLSCNEQLPNNLALFDLSELLESKQKSLLSLNNSFIYPDIVNFPNIFPDTESYLEQLAQCRNPNSFFLDESKIPRRYFYSTEAKIFNDNSITSSESDPFAVNVGKTTHQWVSPSNNKSKVTSQFTDVCSNNLLHERIIGSMDSNDSAMNNGKENGEDVVVRGKNRCQERCPEFSSMGLHLQGFETVVTGRDSEFRDRGSKDTPGITESSNVEVIHGTCLREVPSESTEPASASEMLSNVSNPRNIINITVPSGFQKNNNALRYNGTVDNAIYSSGEITGSVSKPRVICDSLVYRRCKAREGLEEFPNLDNAPEENNLDSDKRFEKSSCSLAKLDSGNSRNISRLQYSFSNENTSHSNINNKEVSFPLSEYTRQPFTLSDALEDFATTAAGMDTSEVMKNKLNSDKLIACGNIQSANDYNIPQSKSRKKQTFKSGLEYCANEKHLPNSINYSSKSKVPSLVQNKNLINHSKNSMIPCKTTIMHDSNIREFPCVDSKVKIRKSGLPVSDKINFVEQNAIKTTSHKSMKNNKIRVEPEFVSAKIIHNTLPKHMKNNVQNRRNSLNENSVPAEFMVSIKSQDPLGRRYSESLTNANTSTSNTNSETSSSTCNVSSKPSSSSSNLSVLNQTFQVAFKTSNPAEVHSNILEMDERQITSTQLGGLNDSVDISVFQPASVFNTYEEDTNVSTCSLVDTVSSTTPSVTSDASINETFDFDVTSINRTPTHVVNGLHSSCSSLPAVIPRVTSVPSRHSGIFIERNNIKSDVICQEKSRIPKKQAGPRGAPNTSRPVRPPMWLSKAELTQEIQRLSSLCEIRTKELNRLKMETKHVSMGFDAFSALFKYMVEDLNALSVPNLAADLDSTLKKLELTKQDLAYYEREVEEIKAHHCQELNDLSNKLFEVYQTEVAELNAKHQEEINQLNDDHQKQLENLSLNFNTSSEEIKAQHEKLISKLEEELRTQREEMRLFQEREIKDLEEKHTQSTKVLQEHIEQLQKKCAELKQHSMSMEDAMRKDTDSKLQWVTSRKVDLEKEVESLKTVLEMKNKELHTLRIQNLEMEKQLEELPFAREKIKMLQARAEDLEALMNEKTKIERKLCSENQEIRDIYEKESKVNRRLSMENEELQWRLRQAEQSLLAGSFPEADETREETDDATTPSSKSSAPPQILSKSVFFTYVDKDESSAFSPRTPYKRITPGFSSSYKTSPGKASKSHLTPSPRKAKSHSEPPLPPSFSSTPRKMSKQASPKGSKKRQKSGSESCPHPEENEIILSVTESMASSVSSENSIPEQKETLLEEHKEHIMASLEIIREQRNTHDSNEVQMSQSMIEQQVSRPSNFEIDMSRSAEFADPKSYYHMTFAVPKEPGMGDGDTDSSKVSSCNSSKEITPVTMHSISESSLSYNQQKNTDAIKINISTTEISTSETVNSNTENESTQIKPAHSDENFQKEENACDIADHWRTI